MRWADYEARFRLAASENGKDDAYVRRCLAYARPLVAKGLPVIYDHRHFSQLTGVHLKYLYSSVHSPSRYYREFAIQKRSGGTRTLREPYPLLKQVQRWILDGLLVKLPVSRHAFAYVPSRRIKDHASRHTGKQVVLRLDIKNFFPTLGGRRVSSLFASLGYSPDLAEFLGDLCSFGRELPQGAPTSPALSNLLFRNLDNEISTIASSVDARYSRYADDMVISGDFPVGFIVRSVERVLRREELTLNRRKTRVMRASQRQEVCGIVVNQGLSVRRETKRSFSQEVHYIKKYGLEAHQLFRGSRRARYLQHLLGVGTWIAHIEPSNQKVNNEIAFLRELERRYTGQNQLTSRPTPNGAPRSAQLRKHRRDDR